MTSSQILSKWMVTNCNGDWEHSYGVKISTLDNPGWSIDIDLESTHLSNKSYSYKAFTGNQDWIDINVNSNMFSGRGDINKYEQIIYEFYNFFIRSTHDESDETLFLYEIYLPIKIGEYTFYILSKAKVTDLQCFEVIEIIYDLKAIKVERIEDFEKIQNSWDLKMLLQFKVGDIVYCEGVMLYDHINLSALRIISN